MTEKKKLFEKLLTILFWIAIGYAIYRGMTLSSSPNLFKELQGAWYIFVALSGIEFFGFDTIYYVTKTDAQRHGTVRSPKARTIIRRVSDFLTYMLVFLIIVMAVIMTIYFFAILIASAFLLTLSKNLVLYEIFITTVLVYFVVMYYGIEVWRYKRAHKPIGTA